MRDRTKSSSPSPNVLPGFGLTMGYTIVYLSLIALIPLSTLVLKTAGMGWARFWHVVASPRVVAAYELSFGTSLAGALINAVFGMLVAWTLVRYRFPGRSIVDALVDLPFALPTAVAGIALTAVYSANGWIGRLLAPAGNQGRVHAARRNRRADLHRSAVCSSHGAAGAGGTRPEVEEAAATLGASRLQTFRRVIFPEICARAADRLRARLCARRSASTARWFSSPATCRCEPRSPRC